MIKYRDGTVERLARPDGALSVDWSPQGHALLVFRRPGADVAVLAIGYRSTIASSPLRYAEAVPGPLFARLAANFQLAIGVFLGTVGSALIYNLFIGAGLRYAFQRIYILWSILALLNGLLASGELNDFVPALAGPTGILANKLVLAGLFASGTSFLLALIEEDILPAAMMRLGLVTTFVIAATGPLAALEAHLPTGMAGELSTAFMALNILVIVAVAAVAARRGSRAVWFYLAGWSPILIFGLVLVAYDLSLLRHSQMMDVGGLLAVSFEAVVLSLAIADRFRRLQHEHDELEHAQHLAEADRAALHKVANTDQLTGLCNRRAFDEAFDAAKHGKVERLALILIDVDHFKRINDRLGHETGDDLLAAVAQQLRTSVRASDVVARLGGDEFAILLQGADAHHVDQIIRELVSAQGQAAHAAAGEVTFSVGAALFPEDGSDPAKLYKNADLALYEAKRLGRARGERYSPILRSRDRQRLALARA